MELAHRPPNHRVQPVSVPCQGTLPGTRLTRGNCRAQLVARLERGAQPSAINSSKHTQWPHPTRDPDNKLQETTDTTGWPPSSQTKLKDGLFLLTQTCKVCKRRPLICTDTNAR